MTFNPHIPDLFLDIDGVLNCNELYSARDDTRLRSTDPKLSKVRDLDPRAVQMLNDIDCNIIISSTWRKFTPIDSMRKMFELAGYTRNQIISYTPCLNFPSACRGNEIAEWLKVNRRDIDNAAYAILDDDGDMLLEQARHFVHVDNFYGLSPNHVYRVDRIFKKLYTHN